ncbi:Transglutaminase domain-containing protein [Sulfidibacter corallicola]|uniref:Transglutaminase domain-containing protein n=1 Tax=Sulfidibacter corallicola TaxID=2818388 RepID=A0A8A4TT34_SULCO|nr:transglutaminase-like domain-containing protein [Sulfidibacter corallicola]QTD52212.1 transglutaminase domain-containing protein [Sulfidibacter corallicola]
MVRSVFLVFLLTTGISISAQSNQVTYANAEVRWLAQELFDELKKDTGNKALYHVLSRADRVARDRQVDAVTFLLNRSEALAVVAPEKKGIQIDENALPNYSRDVVAQTMLDLYFDVNDPANPALRLVDAEPARLAVFYALVDRMDGRLDARLDTPNLDGLYELWIQQGAPVASLCFDCRLDQRWADRRGLINTDGLEGLLPRRLVRFLKSSHADKRKVNRLASYIRREVVPVEEEFDQDFWQTPYETLMTGTGDCEDFAILFQAIAEKYQIPTKLVVGKVALASQPGQAQSAENDAVEASFDHAWVVFDGQVVDLTARSELASKVAYKPILALDSNNGWFLSAKND